MAGVYLVCAVLVWTLPLIRSDAVTTDQSHHSSDLGAGTPTVVVTESMNNKSVPSPNMLQQPTPAVSQAQGLLPTSNTGKSSDRSSPTILGLRTDKTTGMPVGTMSAVTSTAAAAHNPSIGVKGLSPTKAKTNPSSRNETNSTLEIQTGTPPIIHVMSHSDASTKNTETKTNVQFGPTELSLNPTTADIHQPTLSWAHTQTTAPERFSTLQHSINDSPTTEQTFTVHPTSATPMTTQVSSMKAVSTDNATAGVTTVTAIKAIAKPKAPIGPPRSDREDFPGIVVAVLIGGALLLMMASFAVIFLRMRRRQSRQLVNTAWAGPSPFLDGGVGHGGQVEMRASNRISLSGFLPQRLSKRMSLLKEVDETKHLTAGVTFGREKDDEVTTENGIALVDEKKTTTQEIRTDTLGAEETKLPPPTTDPEPVVAVSQFNSNNPPPPPDLVGFISVELDPTVGQEIRSFQPNAADTAPPPMSDDDPVQPLEQAPTPPTVHDATDSLPPPLLDVDLGLTVENHSPSTADLVIPPAPPLPGSVQGH